MRDKLFDNLLGIRREMLKLAGEVSSLTGNPLAIEDAMDDIWHPHCDVFQSENQWIILVELAGVKKEEISISITKEYIRIAGERQLQIDSCPTRYYNMEIETGRFDRRIFFPDISLSKDTPHVTYADGILKIVFELSPVVERIIPIS